MTELNAEKTKTLLHKLKANVYHNSGKANKYLANRLRARNANTKTARIVGDDGTQHQTPADISREFAKFYSKLYNLQLSGATYIASHTEIDDFLRQTNLPNCPLTKKHR
ncbi:Hypothetical predicted protein [Pelobates cultripes]|uniref:Uncharacterized protein n=1 Tax=Pelobates cultripes TaxID=61616 RepID=A0AAD1VYE0_PELCU|nr:Hypothetical predicted protein [Pelobates cultripes]